MTDTIWEQLIQISDDAKEWIIDHQNNPLLWIGLFLIGLLVFFAIFNALNKEK